MSVKIFNFLKNFERKKICLKKTSTFCYSLRYWSRFVNNNDLLPTRYGGKTNVTVLPGSGIGPEIMDCTLEVLKAAGAPLSYEILELSSTDDSVEDFEYALTSIRRNRVALKGNIEIQSKNPHVSSRNIILRKTLDLFVYILSCSTFPGLPNKFGDIDITVIRQNTEGEYLMLEHEPTAGSVESLKVITTYNSERLAEFAFNYALTYKKKRVTVVHNADVQVGVAVVKIAKDPKHFDIILTTNLNGSMVSNYLNGMLGGPGLSSGINFSDNGIAVFEPGARNKGSSIVGKGIANPIAMIMAGTNLLNYLGYHKTAETIRNSVFATLVYDKIHTQDLGGKASSKDVTESVIHHIKQRLTPKIQKKQDHLLRHRWKNYCYIPDDNHPK